MIKVQMLTCQMLDIMLQFSDLSNVSYHMYEICTENSKQHFED